MISWLERKIGWIAFPSIIKYLALFQLGMVGLTFLNPKAIELIKFNWPAILTGEYWRILSFIFVPIGQLSGEGGSLVALFAVFAALIMMQFSDGIEARLGAFRTTLYFLTGWIVCSIASIVFSVHPMGLLGVTPDGTPYTVVNLLPPGMLFDAGILFAFATFHPKFTLLLFFVLPVQIWILAIVTGAMLALNASTSLGSFLYFIIAISHYLILAIGILRSKKGSNTLKPSLVKAKLQPKSTSTSFHSCDICGKKDSDDPSASFRVTQDGKELCLSCLNDLKKN